MYGLWMTILAEPLRYGNSLSTIEYGSYWLAMTRLQNCRCQRGQQSKEDTRLTRRIGQRIDLPEFFSTRRWLLSVCVSGFSAYRTLPPPGRLQQGPSLRIATKSANTPTAGLNERLAWYVILLSRCPVKRTEHRVQNMGFEVHGHHSGVRRRRFRVADGHQSALA